MIIEEHTFERDQHTTAWLDEDDVPESGRVIVKVIVHDYGASRHTVLSGRKVQGKKGSRKSTLRVTSRR